MNRMFYYSKAFNQQIDQWSMAEKVSMQNMFSFAYEFRRHIAKIKFFNPKLYLKIIRRDSSKRYIQCS